MKTKTYDKTILIQVNSERYARWKEGAKAIEETTSSLIRDAVEYYLNHLQAGSLENGQ